MITMEIILLILFITLSAVMTPSLGFALGSLINITVIIGNQNSTIVIKGKDDDSE